MPHVPHKVAALVSDQDDGETAGYDLPEPSKDGAIEGPVSPVEEDGQLISRDEAEKWSHVGGAPRFGNPGDQDQSATLLDHEDLLETRLDDKLFGDWYHNTAVIIFACLASWTVAVLGGGLAWVFIIMAFCATYYRTSIRRVRRNFRDDIQREVAKAKLETEVESIEWINIALIRMWPILYPWIGNVVRDSVNQIISTSVPAFLDSMRMESFILGTKPPRMEHVKTYTTSEEDTIMMDWKFSFTPNDTADLTARQLKLKINPKVVLEVRLGVGLASKALKVIVEDMACSGLMRIKMKLQLDYPFIERAELCFLERPTFDYKLNPLVPQSFGFDINFVPGLEGFINEQVHGNLGPMMYAPNVFPIEIAKLLAGTAVDQAIGVLSLTFHGAQGLKNTDKFAGTPDPYATVSINDREELGRTKKVDGNANPRWNETVNVILTSLREPLTITVWDFNDIRKDKELGKCVFQLEQLEADPEHENLQLEVISSGRPRGIVQADIRFFPVLEGKKLEDGTVEPPPESNTGIAKFTVEQAKDLDGTKSMVGALNPYAVLLLNGKEVAVSKKLSRTNSPVFPNATKEMLITDRKTAKLGLVIKDDKDLAIDPVIGTYQIKLDDMIDLMSKGQEWYNLAGAKTGRAKMLLQWKPVALKGALSGSGGYITPIGVMRFHFQSGRDLKNLDKVGKSDPYMRVLLSGIPKGRTVTWKNNLNPEWDEIFYVPVHSPREKLVVEVMDEETTQDDRTMGQLEIAASEYVKLGEDGRYLPHDSKDKVITAHVRIGSSAPKGTINFTVAFYPCLNVVDPEEEEHDMAEAKAKAADAEKAATQATSSPQHSRSHTAGTIASVTSEKSTKQAQGEAEMRKALAEGEDEQVETNEVQEASVPKVRIGPEDLTKYEPGVLIFRIIDGQLAHPDTHLEVVMDDNLFPAYSSAKARSTNFTFNETGDTVVRELDLSRITLRLVSGVNRKGEEKDDPIKAKITGQTLDVLRRCLYTPTQISLRDDQGRVSKITVSMRFLPIEMQLDPSESFNNSGNLRVDVLDAIDLPAADRNGYSDPFCRFVLNGKEVYKTEVQKKTLHPAWNEFFEVPVRSRTAAKFEVNVYDWDLGKTADFLGKAAINLDLLQPLEAQEVTLGLDGKSGSIRLKMLFKPDFVVRSRQGSSTFSGTFAAPGKIVGAPVKGVGKGAVFVGGTVAKGAGFLGRGFKRRTNSGMPASPSEEGANGGLEDMHETSMESTSPGRPETANGTAPHANYANGDGANKELPATPAPAHKRVSSYGGMSQAAGRGESGTATVTVVSASGFEGDPKLEVHVLHDTPKGLKKVVETDHHKAKDGAVHYEETKKIQCTADSQFRVQVRNHKPFGSDILGEAAFFINDQAQGGQQDVKVGSGTVVLRTSFQSADAASMLQPPGAESPASSKKGGLNRFMTRNSRNVTPSG
ncbi:hypothetical protein BAUCODRAFT_351320 [Baudoinia panamericana UAMH 10762]|uniref:Tricalbin n=1 Tax=Baudoinia panamericana (strain UAMH 10762) TaxID=717646 RepID=M2NKY4_BAUPA|nr:uncharacterized protein BAUCODRAFT_351320 [Baudoinia panamericana UAMH 10762]EMC99805.1 hypothetical protein BAUCODRAFT_351320 [Baudoinia panamericana UAMH 10762]